MSLNEKNPKENIGIKKVPLSTIPANVLAEIGLAMFEGARKYGRHNYRIAGIRSSIYYDAVLRHLIAWWENEDIDEDSGLNHITKALACLVILRDAQLNNKITDDRPPIISDSNWIKNLNKKTEEITKKYPEIISPYTKEQSLNT